MLQFSFKAINMENFARLCDEVWGDTVTEERRRQVLEQLGMGERLIYVIDLGGQFIGEASLTFDDEAEKRLVLDHIQVTQEYRGQGFGGMLAEYAANMGQDMGYDELSAEIPDGDMELRRFFYGHGFIKAPTLHPDRLSLVRDLNAEHHCKGCRDKD